MVPCLLQSLKDQDPQVRGLSAWALGRLAVREAREPLRNLLADEAPVQLYDRGEVHAVTVAQLAREALAVFE